MIRRWFAIVLVLALVSGTVLSIPAFWSRPVVGQKSSQIARHWLDCVFTATSALTGTGLSPHDVGDDFNLPGQALIFAYMQLGGLGVLIFGAVLGWRFRERFRWGVGDEDQSGKGLRRLILFVCVLTLLLEGAGAAALHFADPEPETPARTVFAPVFHSVSAFCNTGLTLTRNSFVSQGETWPPYAILLPLMVLGSIGGPVLYELWRKLLKRNARSAPLSRDTRVTLLGTAALILAGAAVIFFTESTPRWQLRNPREDSEHIKLNKQDEGDVIEFSPEGSSRVMQERMQTMPPGRRAAAALFQSVSARSTGFRVARIDEQSLSLADRAVTILLMLVGGGLGGTAGGLRIVIVFVLLGTLLRPTADPAPLNGQDADPPHGRNAAPTALKAAAGIASAMTLLIAFTALFLIYREPAAPEACVFEAVSACCNVGFTTGLTRTLQPESQVVVILAMLLGRIVPLAMLANQLRNPRNLQ